MMMAQYTAQEMASFLKSNAPSKADGARVDAALQHDAAATGILLHTRLLNCPYQLGPPLQKQLFGELQAALEEPFSKVPLYPRDDSVAYRPSGI